MSRRLQAVERAQRVVYAQPYNQGGCIVLNTQVGFDNVVLGTFASVNEAKAMRYALCQRIAAEIEAALKAVRP